MEHSDSQELPLDNEGWFKRHIIQQLSDLKKGQEAGSTRQEAMHAAITATLSSHADEDLKRFAAIEKDLSELEPVRRVVYAALGLILAAFMTAVIALVVRGH